MHWSAKVLCWVMAISLHSGSYVVLQRLLRGPTKGPEDDEKKKKRPCKFGDNFSNANHTP